MYFRLSLVQKTSINQKILTSSVCPKLSQSSSFRGCSHATALNEKGSISRSAHLAFLGFLPLGVYFSTLLACCTPTLGRACPTPAGHFPVSFAKGVLTPEIVVTLLFQRASAFPVCLCACT